MLYRDAAGRDRREETSVSREVFEGLNVEEGPESSGPPPTMRVRHVSLGGWHYAMVLGEGDGPWEQVGFTLFFCLFWNGVVGGHFYVLRIHPWRARRLYRWGAATRGKIVAKYGALGPSSSRALGYTFEVDGRQVEGRMKVGNLSDWDRAAIGEAVTVLHWPGRADPSVIYEYGACEVTS